MVLIYILKNSWELSFLPSSICYILKKRIIRFGWITIFIFWLPHTELSLNHASSFLFRKTQANLRHLSWPLTGEPSLFPCLHGFFWVLVTVQTPKGIFRSFSCIFFTRAQFALKFSLESYLQGWSRAQAQKRPALQMSKMGHFCYLTFIAACIADSLYLLYIPVVLTIHGLASTQATFIDSTHGKHMLLHLPHKNKKK